MELKDALRSISNDARGWLKAWAGDFTEAEASQPADHGTAPNPLSWQLGHLACVEEDVARLFSENPAPAPLVPSALRGICSTGAPTPTAHTRYLPLADLWKLLEGTHERLLAVLEAAEPPELDRPPREKNPYFHSLAQGVYEAALHENYHVGEIAALRKVLGKPRIG